MNGFEMFLKDKSLKYLIFSKICPKYQFPVSISQNTHQMLHYQWKYQDDTPLSEKHHEYTPLPMEYSFVNGVSVQILQSTSNTPEAVEYHLTNMVFLVSISENWYFGQINTQNEKFWLIFHFLTFLCLSCTVELK